MITLSNQSPMRQIKRMVRPVVYDAIIEEKEQADEAQREGHTLKSYSEGPYRIALCCFWAAASDSLCFCISVSGAPHGRGLLNFKGLGRRSGISSGGGSIEQHLRNQWTGRMHCNMWGCPAVGLQMLSGRGLAGRRKDKRTTEYGSTLGGFRFALGRRCCRSTPKVVMSHSAALL